MAGKDIYLGKMMEALDTKLTSVMSKMDDQITAVNGQVALLSDVAQNTGQTITQLNLAPGTENEFILTTAEKQNTTTSVVVVAKTIMRATGSMTLSGRIRSAQSATTAYVKYSIDKGATWIDAHYIQGTTFSAFNVTVPAIIGEIWIGIYTLNNGTAAILESGCKLKYNIVPMINTSPFAILL